jgi:hypothetical protein
VFGNLNNDFHLSFNSKYFLHFDATWPICKLNTCNKKNVFFNGGTLACQTYFFKINILLLILDDTIQTHIIATLLLKCN